MMTMNKILYTIVIPKDMFQRDATGKVSKDLREAADHFKLLIPDDYRGYPYDRQSYPSSWFIDEFKSYEEYIKDSLEHSDFREKASTVNKNHKVFSLISIEFIGVIGKSYSTQEEFDENQYHYWLSRLVHSAAHVIFYNSTEEAQIAYDEMHEDLEAREVLGNLLGIK